MSSNNIVLLKPVRTLNFLVICGVSGSGKSMLEKNLCSAYPDMFVKCEQVTTRNKRSPDEDTYRFIDAGEYTNISHLLIGKTNIRTSEANTFYGTLVNWNERNRVQTIILNERGITNFLENDVINMVNDGININYSILGLDRTDLEEIQKLAGREERNANFLQEERTVLKRCNYIANVNTNEYANEHEVMKLIFPNYHNISGETNANTITN